MYTPEGSLNLENLPYQDTYYKYWGLQQNTGTTVKTKVSLGSQVLKQFFSGIYEEGKAIDPHLSRLANQLTAVLDNMLRVGTKQLQIELGVATEDGEYFTEDINPLIDSLQQFAADRGNNNNVIEGLESLRTLMDGTSGLDVLTGRDKIEQILASMADSRVISPKVNGGAKVQSSSALFELTAQRPVDTQGNLVSFDPNDPLNARPEFYAEDGVMEVYLPHYFSQLYKQDYIKIEDPKLLRAIGFRIPTSGPNVIEKIRIKGFLPQAAGEVVVVPSELVGKAGSDFDVDKLFMLLPNYRILNVLNLAESPRHGRSSGETCHRRDATVCHSG